ncbi:tripartite ATP-independent transporter solute receptor, DctP family [Caldanaerovirga acetigignens]|uniref:Tripartite ATP-independent transporter solute receptor, DctP family n=1 Tax=Caldanaerovirga acetigignens TaxID=447595 RepID=A0A1M7GKS6_9FIRM|nr:TRAP transporter substrate-binding protein [Caldanaerovirga acetigignens]SHM16527.1 tripartite ATP-independent transporter solute receptor, DctP family [Caldanaerovirga acetigignens]
MPSYFVKKIAILLCLILLAFTFTGCGQKANNSGSQQGAGKSEPQLVLKLAENQPEDYPTTIGDKEFARLVEEKTNGRIKIEVYAGGQLGDEKSVIEAIQLGGIDFARVNAQPLSDFAKPLRVLSLPYLFDNEEHLWKVLDGPIGEELLDTLKESNMIGLAYYDSGARSFYNSKREVKTPADLKGLKIRVQQSELMVALVEALGASATPMPYGEVYSALQTGVIDGAENNWPSYYSTSHYEVAKYYTLDNHTRTPEVLIASKALWDKLSEEDKKIIKEAARASEAVQKRAWKEYEQKAIEAVKAKGNVITEITDLKPWQDAVQPLYERFGAEYKDLIERIKAVK